MVYETFFKERKCINLKYNKLFPLQEAIPAVLERLSDDELKREARGSENKTDTVSCLIRACKCLASKATQNPGLIKGTDGHTALLFTTNSISIQGQPVMKYCQDTYKTTLQTGRVSSHIVYFTKYRFEIVLIRSIILHVPHWPRFPGDTIESKGFDQCAVYSTVLTQTIDL